MSLPTNRIKKIKLADATEYEIIPERLQNSGFSASLPTLSADATLALTSDIPTESTVSDWGFTKNSGTITKVQLNGTDVASSGTANVKALPNFSLNISHQTAGNPRQVKFLTVDYNTKATYFKMSATSCHDNGTSYQFLEDIIIGCTTSGTVVCNVYKYCQQAVTLDNVARNYGDVFYVIDTTNKKVDFYILCGQWASSQFTPATKIGNTTIAYITQYTGTATYYSSGTKVWADGDSALYVRTGDLKTVNGNSLIGSGDITITAPAPSNMVTTDTTQTISGAKTFTGYNKIKSTGIDFDTNPSAIQYKFIDFTDKDDARLGILGVKQNTDGAYGVYAQIGNIASLQFLANRDGSNQRLIPSSNGDINLGTSNYRWKSVYAGTTGVRSTGSVISDSNFDAARNATAWDGFSITNHGNNGATYNMGKTNGSTRYDIGCYKMNLKRTNSSSNTTVDWVSALSTCCEANSTNIRTRLETRQATTDGGTAYKSTQLDLFASNNYSWVTVSANDVRPSGNGTTDLGMSDHKWRNIYGTTIYENGTALSSKYYPKSGGALNNDAVIAMTGSNPYVGLQETGGTQYYLQGYQGEVGISVGGNWATKRISLNSSGAVTIPGTVSASSVFATSDRRLKENIKPAELDCGKVIDDLQIKEFNFIDDEEKKVVVGAIAQELQEILPEKYRAELVGGSEDTQYTINEGKLLFIAIGALKEERAKTKELEERLARIEAKLEV